MHNLMQDIRYGARMLSKNRLATVVCAAALALGIGANTAIFSVAEGFLLHPVPFKDSGRLAAIVNVRPEQNIDRNAIAPATFLDWKEQAKSFEKLDAYVYDEVNLTGVGQAEKIQGIDVTADFFSTLGVKPLIGRTFLPEEQVPGKDQEIILSYGLWERRFASDLGVLGRIVKVDGKAFTIVGVMGKGFDFPRPGEAWIPLALTPKQKTLRDSRYLWPIGQLGSGVSLKQAAAELNTIGERQASEFPEAYKGWQLRLMSIREFATSDLTRQYTLLLLGAVGFVLLIACADVANVQFARLSGRQKELAVRTAMGASRSRIISQLLTESILLSLVGAGLGLIFAQWDIALILSHMPPDVARFIAGWNTISLDKNAFLFTLGIALMSGIVSGIAPALMVSRTNISETLKESGRGSSAGRARQRVRNILVVAEISLSLILLVGAGLLVRGFGALLNVNEKCKPETLLTFTLSLPESQYKEPAQRLAFHEKALQGLAGLPGVRSASIVSNVPYSGGGGINTRSFAIEGRSGGGRSEVLAAIVQTVSPNYFGVMNIEPREGRLLENSDGNETVSVAVISRSLVRRYFVGENPLGRKVRVNPEDETSPWMTIVGIVDDVHYSWIVKEDIPTIYRSFRQTPRPYISYMLRTEGDPSSFTSAARSQIAVIDPEIPIFEVKALDKVISDSIIGIEYVAAMMGVMGVIALVLASVGVYGVMSYAVAERTNEFGIRMAMGATAGDIQKLVLGKGFFLTALGVGLGLPLAFAMANALSSLLFGVSAADPLAFIVLPLVLATVSMLASYLPALRAVRVDPIVALRYE